MSEILNGCDGKEVVEIDESENGGHIVWDLINNSPIGEYQDLKIARASAKIAVEKYNQEQNND